MSRIDGLIGGFRRICFAGIFSGLLITEPLCAKTGIEIIPLAVWQGKQTRPWSVSILRDIRKKFPNLKFAHAVSAAPMARGGDGAVLFRSKFSRLVQPGDDVLLHVAPWKSLVEKSKLKFRLEPTVFGVPVNLEDCSLDCGLDLSVTAFSESEIRELVDYSKGVLAASGFGAVQAVFFDEGVVSPMVRRAVINSGISEDWSGVELSQLRGSLLRFPVYAWNMENVRGLPLNDFSVSLNDGLDLDHLRFAIQAEIGDIETAARIIKSAIEESSKGGRVARVPVVFNVEDLIHTQAFVEESIEKIMQMASDASIPVREWRAKNSTWDAESIRRGVSTNNLVANEVVGGDEAEFVSDDERLLSIETAH